MKTLMLTSAMLMTCFLFREGDGHIFTKKPRPHILFVMMADMGWNDMGVHDPNMQTPTIDRLYNEGFRMNYAYADPSGSASRAALLSGNFSFTMGLQDDAINRFSPAHVPLTHDLLPTALKNHGYFTHMIGKWDQGFCHLDKTPTYRGFDTFFGEYTSASNSSSMISEEASGTLRKNMDDDKHHDDDDDHDDDFSADVYGKQAYKTIKKHGRKYPNNEHPFFILLSFADSGVPKNIPGSNFKNCKRMSFATPERKIRCGLMAAVDKALGRIMDALEDTNQAEKTIIVFTSDNGGAVQHGSSNWPLRGNKGTVWEGGIRVPTFIWGGSKSVLPKQNHTYNGLFHMVDWYPTLVGFAKKMGRSKLTKAHAPAMDGFNHWALIKRGVKKSFRTEFAYMVNETDKEVTYVRQKDFKLVAGETASPGWYTPTPQLNVSEPVEPTMSYRFRPYRIYNIVKDPNETRDLSKSKVPRNAAARESLLDLWSDFQARYTAKVTSTYDSC